VRVNSIVKARKESHTDFVILEKTGIPGNVTPCTEKAPRSIHALPQKTRERVTPDGHQRLGAPEQLERRVAEAFFFPSFRVVCTAHHQGLVSSAGAAHARRETSVASGSTQEEESGLAGG